MGSKVQERLTTPGLRLLVRTQRALRVVRPRVARLEPGAVQDHPSATTEPPGAATRAFRAGGVAACLIAILLPGPLLAQRVVVEVVDASRWLATTAAERRVTVALTLKETALRVLFEEGRLVLVRGAERPDERRDERTALPTRHTTLLFADGRGVLQYATSPLDGSTEILWLRPDGSSDSRETVALGFLPLVAMGPDGSCVFAGSGTPPADSGLDRVAQARSPDRQMVAFSSTGRQLWRRPIEPTRAVVLLAIASGGESSVAVTADRLDPLTGHRLEAFASSGEPVGAVPLEATAQRLVLVPGQPLLWVQTTRGHEIFELGAAGPRSRWRQSERRCTGSAGSAATDARAQHLFLIDRDCSDDARFQWRLSVLAMADGKALQASSLDAAWLQENPSAAREPIRPSVADWIQVGADQVRAAVGDHLFVWRWGLTQ